MALDYGERIQLPYETTSKGKRKLFSAFKRIMRGNKDGCGMRGGGGTRRGRSVTSGPTCRRTIILMMMILVCTERRAQHPERLGGVRVSGPTCSLRRRRSKSLRRRPCRYLGRTALLGSRLPGFLMLLLR